MALSSHPGPTGPGGSSRTPRVKNVGEPCAGEPHARFDGRELETEHADHGHRGGTPVRETGGTQAPGPTSQPLPPRQLPTQPSSDPAPCTLASDSRCLGGSTRSSAEGFMLSVLTVRRRLRVYVRVQGVGLFLDVGPVVAPWVAPLINAFTSVVRPCSGIQARPARGLTLSFRGKMAGLHISVGVGRGDCNQRACRCRSYTSGKCRCANLDVHLDEILPRSWRLRRAGEFGSAFVGPAVSILVAAHVRICLAALGETPSRARGYTPDHGGVNPPARRGNPYPPVGVRRSSRWTRTVSRHTRRLPKKGGEHAANKLYDSAAFIGLNPHMRPVRIAGGREQHQIPRSQIGPRGDGAGVAGVAPQFARPQRWHRRAPQLQQGVGVPLATRAPLDRRQRGRAGVGRGEISNRPQPRRPSPGKGRRPLHLAHHPFTRSLSVTNLGIDLAEAGRRAEGLACDQ